uniref:Uncharacterized protein n=1 Tax=Arundo donax TaxID=35708 RepID=A0A0A8ZLL9_ARUDO
MTLIHVNKTQVDSTYILSIKISRTIELVYCSFIR